MATRNKEAKRANAKTMGRTRAPAPSENVSPPNDSPKSARPSRPGRSRSLADTPPRIKPAETTPARRMNPKPKPAALDDRTVFDQLVNQANAGQREAIIELREFLGSHIHIWQWPGALTAIAERAWIGLNAGNDSVHADSIQRRLDEIKAGLMGPSLALLESRLIEEISANWLGTQFVEGQVASSPGGSIDQLSSMLCWVEGARKRRQLACKLLRLLQTHRLRTLVALYAEVSMFAADSF